MNRVSRCTVRRRPFALGAVALVGVLAACGADGDDSLRSIAAGGASDGTASPVVVTEASSNPGSSADPAPLDTTVYPSNGQVVEVLSIDNNFLPQVVEVTAGTEVHWANNGRNDHDVTPADDVRRLVWGATADDFTPGDEYSHVFDQIGTYTYFCSIHGTATAGMFGTVVVTPP